MQSELFWSFICELAPVFPEQLAAMYTAFKDDDSAIQWCNFVYRLVEVYRLFCVICKF